VRTIGMCSVLLTTAIAAAGQDLSQTPIQIPSHSTQTRLLHRVTPRYPPLARAARVQGIVVLGVVIGKGGDVRDVKIVSGHPMLAPAAMKAIKQWRYQPYIAENEPVEIETTVQVSFRLADGAETNGRMQEASSLSPPPPPPVTPPLAKAGHIEGAVVLNVDIDAEGNVGRVELASGNPRLAAAAMDAVLRWRYRPFTLNGEALQVETTVEVKFTLAQ